MPLSWRLIIYGCVPGIYPFCECKCFSSAGKLLGPILLGAQVCSSLLMCACRLSSHAHHQAANPFQMMGFVWHVLDDHYNYFP